LKRDRERLGIVIERDGQTYPFHSLESLAPGDRVNVLQVPETSPPPYDSFDGLVKRATILDLEGSISAEAFFTQAAAGLAPAVGVTVSELANALHSRETTSSTVLLPGLAIPHVTVDGEGHFEILIARSRGGVRFPGRPQSVRAVFVVAGSADQRTLHLQTLSAIAQIVQWPDFEQRWRGAVDAEAIRRFILGSARRRFHDDKTPLHQP
jgi:mannitol/fructose-specific phosphotransferase system IIA component (Ntr-type)